MNSSSEENIKDLERKNSDLKSTVDELKNKLKTLELRTNSSVSSKPPTLPTPRKAKNNEIDESGPGRGPNFSRLDMYRRKPDLSSTVLMQKAIEDSSDSDYGSD